jgi:NAD(P)-dependent dehydrogenase (short-subunit alcohol dehydrogenase family)
VTADYLIAKTILVLGSGDTEHRGVAVALAQAGANVVIGGVAPELPAQAALHSIANEIWALGRQSGVVTMTDDSDVQLEAALKQAAAVLKAADLVVSCTAPERS